MVDRRRSERGRTHRELTGGILTRYSTRYGKALHGEDRRYSRVRSIDSPFIGYSRVAVMVVVVGWEEDMESILMSIVYSAYPVYLANI